MTAAIAADAIRLINALREHSRSQASLWQQLPSLALMADGRSGYNASLQRAYREGYWTIESGDHRHTVLVDCASGEIVHQSKRDEPAPDASVLLLATDPAALDAAGIIAELRAMTEAPIGPGYDQVSHAAKLAADQKVERKKLRLGKYFVRR